MRKKFYPSLACLAIAISAIMWAMSAPSDYWLKHRAVKIQNGHGSCSGEQVRAPSGIDYILTAAHCRALMGEDSQFEVKTESGKILKRRMVNEDTKSDLLILEGLPGVRGLDIADYAPAGSTIRTFTHGGGMDTYKTEGDLVQYEKIEIPLQMNETEKQQQYCDSMPKYYTFEPLPGFRICILSVIETATTAWIIPGSSGGMAVDASGQLVGVVSAYSGRFGYLVPLKMIQEFLSNY